MLDMRVLPNQPLIKFNHQLPIFNWHYPLVRDDDLTEDRRAPYPALKNTDIRRRAIYIHIPFCETICNFCPFDRNKYQSQSDVDEYVKALLAEIDLKRNFLGRPGVDAIFVGGGTPSLLNPRHIESLGAALSRNFDLRFLKEFSFEVEVKSATREKFETMHEIGVNRISFGAQTFSNEYRQLLNLDASLKHIINTAATANSIFPYTNVDLLYGIAGQNVGQLHYDLIEALKLQTTTIDVYPINNLSSSAAMHRNFLQADIDFLPATERIKFRMYIKQFFREHGYVPINGYSFTAAGSVRDDVAGPVQLSRNFLYHDILYGYHDDEIIGYGSSAISQIPGYNIYNFRNRQKYIKEVLLNRALPQQTFGPMSSPERGVVFFPYRGVLDKARIPWEELPAETLTALRTTLNEGLIVDRGDRYELTEPGWLFYVNLMFYFMPSAGKYCILNLIEQQQRKGRRCGNTELTELAQPVM
jgi:coproporphyrinogen III oxidase-like Fe-S oxidoreductase